MSPTPLPSHVKPRPTLHSSNPKALCPKPQLVHSDIMKNEREAHSVYHCHTTSV